jgi:predicted negative regulator of RcsB-dependent stress response
MKRKERAHLKEDPFQIFIEKVLDLLKKFRKEIYIGLIGAVVIVTIVSLAIFLHSTSVSGDNESYSEALSIKKSETLTVDQKIEKLGLLESKKGISASIKLMIAALYFEKGDIGKAKEELDAFKGSKHRLINDQKILLEADVLSALDKKTEAADLLNRIFSDKDSRVAKDFLLLKIARLQAGTGQTSTAITNLKKIGSEFPQSPYAGDAKALLTKLEK